MKENNKNLERLKKIELEKNIGVKLKNRLNIKDQQSDHHVLSSKIEQFDIKDLKINAKASLMKIGKMNFYENIEVSQEDIETVKNKININKELTEVMSINLL